MSKFTDKQQAFVTNKAAGMTNHAAATSAGYGVNSAKVTASQLMQRPDIKAAIKAAKTSGVDTESEPPRMKAKYADSLALLRDVYNNPRMPDGMRIDAAFKALPYEHARIGETGKKETKRQNARQIAGGHIGQAKPKFATKQPPQLRVVPRTDP